MGKNKPKELNMKIKPLFDRVVIKQVKTEQEKNIGGLVLPESSQERPLVAEVLEVGDGLETDGKKGEMVVKKGDKVLFSKYAGSTYKIDNEELIIIRQTDILAILK